MTDDTENITEKMREATEAPTPLIPDAAAQETKTPEKTEEDSAGKLKDEHDKALEATEPLEKPDEEKTEADDGTTAKFKEAATTEETITRKASPQEIKDGRIKTADTILHIGTGQTDMWTLFRQLWLILSAIFSGDWANVKMFSEVFFPKDVYTDPNDRQQRIDTFNEVAITSDHPLRKGPIQDLISGIWGDKFPEALQAMKPQLNELFTLIVDQESNGDANIIWDYRNRTKPGQGPGPNGTWPGLQPGDVTPRNLPVPDITTMTVNQVMAWQQQYLDEQKAAGITNWKLRSTAAGEGQFTLTTLREMVEDKDGVLNVDFTGNETFNLETQRQFKSERLLWRVNRAIEKSDTVNELQSNLKKELGDEWEGLKDPKIQSQLNNIVRGMSENLQNALTPGPQ